MANFLEDYIANMAEEDVITCIQNAETLREEGSIGDCPLRQHTRKCLEKIYPPDTWTGVRPSMWFDRFAWECYRHFAMKYINSIKN